MVRVPTYEQQVSQRPIFQQELAANATAEAFGSGIGRGMQQLGQGLGQAADAVAQVRSLQDTLKAKEALTAFEREKTQLDYGPNGFMTTQGMNAATGLDKYNESLEALRKKYGAALTGAAAQKYSEASTNVVTQGMRSGIIHSAQGTKEWVANTAQANLDLYADQALTAWQNPAEVQKSIALGFGEINDLGAQQGWGPEVLDLKKKEFASGIHTKVALAMAGQTGGAGQAIEYIKKNSALIDPATRMDLEQKLKPFADNEAGMKAWDDFARAPDVGRDYETSSGSPAAAPARARGPTAAKGFLSSISANAGRAGDTLNINDAFAENLAALIQDAPAEIRNGLQVGSGWRSEARQAELWEEALAKYGSPEAARKWVAPHGRSKHGAGTAVDLNYNGRSLKHAPQNVIDWVHSNAAMYGLYFPMSHEPWHIEPMGSRSGGPTGSTVRPSRDGVASRAVMPSYDAIIAKADTITNPDIRAAFLKNAQARLDLDAKAETARTNQAKQSMWEQVLAGTPVSQIPIETRIAAGRETVMGMMDYENKAGEIKTDPVALTNLTLFAAADPVAFSKLDLLESEIINSLSRADHKAMVDKQASILSDTRKAQEEGPKVTAAMSYAQTQLEAVGITTTGEKDQRKIEEIRRREAQFQMQLVQEMEAFRTANNGKHPTEVDLQQMINRMLLPVVVKEPTTNWFGGATTNDTETFLFDAGNIGVQANGRVVELNVEYKNIPVADRLAIKDQLALQGETNPSEDRITAIYEEYLVSKMGNQPSAEKIDAFSGALIRSMVMPDVDELHSRYMGLLQPGL